MKVDLSKALEQCLLWMREGTSLEICLTRYSSMKPQLHPLLCTAVYLLNSLKEVPTDEFRMASKARLIDKARRYTYPKGQKSFFSRMIDTVNDAVLNKVTRKVTLRKVFAPVLFSSIVAIIISLSIYSIPGLFGQAAPLESQCTLSILSGEAEVQMLGSNSWQVGNDGMMLEAGCRVRTAVDAQAVLTFFEGTTVKLQPGTDIQIEKVDGSAHKSAEIVLRQWVGKTWSRVVKKIDPGSRYEIRTPSAYALVRGTMFETDVEKMGSTQVETTEGTVTVGAQNKEVEVSSGLAVAVKFGDAPSDPIQIPPFDSELIITVRMPAVASICDPTAASTGYLPSGISFNQIVGSQSSSPNEGDQVIRIPEPIAGTYKVILRAVGNGVAQVGYNVISNGEKILEQIVQYELADGSSYFIPLDLVFENNQLGSAQIGSIEALNGESPEKVVINKQMKESALPIDRITGLVDPIRLIVRSSLGGSVVVPGEGEFLYEKGTRVSLEAIPHRGYVFYRWNGPVADESLSNTSIILNRDQLITADFRKGAIHVVTIISTEGGSVIEPGQGVFIKEYGALVDLVAEPIEGWKFDRWEGPVSDSSSPVTTLEVKHSGEIIARFIRDN